MSPDGDHPRITRPEGERPYYRLRLFVAGDEPNSLRARAVLTRLCENILRDRCEVVVVDVLRDYQAALDRQVMVVPTLIVEAPPPVRTIVGSLSDEGALREALGLSDFGARS